MLSAKVSSQLFYLDQCPDQPQQWCQKWDFEQLSHETTRQSYASLKAKMSCSCYKSGKYLSCACTANRRQCSDDCSCGKNYRSKLKSRYLSTLCSEEIKFIKKSELQVMLQDLATTIATNLTTRQSHPTSDSTSRAHPTPSIHQ